MQITFDEKKKLDTNPIFHLFVQGENMAESIRIVGPKMVGALDLSQLRMAVRVTSAAYETMVEKTLEQTDTEEDTITLVWNVDKQFTSNPGHAHVMLVGYGNNEEVIKITSSGIEIKEDETFVSAPQGSTWDQVLRKMQDLATQAQNSQTAAAESATSAAASEQVAISKAEEIKTDAEQTLANAQAAAASAAQAAASAASVDPSTFVKQVNGEVPVGGAVSVTTRNLAYQVGDTITTTDSAFNPNSAIGGTWVQQILRSKDTPRTSLPLLNGASGQCHYIVRNGWCSVFLNEVRWEGNGFTLVEGLPPAANIAACSDGGGLRVSIVERATSITAYAAPSVTGYFTLIYPVYDSFSATLYVWTKTA